MSDIVHRAIADLTTLAEQLDPLDRQRIHDIIVKLKYSEEQNDRFVHVDLALLVVG